MERQLVVFTLGGEYYGVDIFVVERIIDMQPVAVVPHAPSFVKGVTDLSGAVLPVLDLRQRFGLPALASTADCRIVVVAVDGATVGMIVDAVSEVVRVPDSEIAPPPDLVLTPVNRAFIQGIAKVDATLEADDAPDVEEADISETGRLVVLLNLPCVLSTVEVSELHTFEEVLLENVVA